MDLEGVSALKGYFNSIGCSSISFFERLVFFDFRISYLLNFSILSFEVASVIFLFFCNLRLEYPLLNSRLRKNFLYNSNGFLPVFCFGFFNDHLSFPVKVLGNNFRIIIDFFFAKIRDFSDFFSNNFINVGFFTLNNFFFFKPLALFGCAFFRKLDSLFYLGSFVSFFRKILPIHEN